MTERAPDFWIIYNDGGVAIFAALICYLAFRLLLSARWDVREALRLFWQLLKGPT